MAWNDGKHPKNFIDITGQRFTKLVVIEQAPPKTGHTYWRCRCDCGNECVVAGAKLKSGETRSCGCIRKEIAPTKDNILFERDGYMVGLTNNGVEFYFDKDDIDKVKEYCWQQDKYGYITAKGRGKQPKNPSRRLHRIVMEPIPDGYYVDHINHNTVDCRKENLRLCTPNQNSYNTKVPITNKSGYKGVCWSKNACKWYAYITHDHITENLGYYDDIADAIKSRRDAEERYHGEFYNKELRNGQ